MGLQAERILRITSSAWEEKLLLDSFSGREGLSQLFEFDLHLSALDDAIAPADIIGQALGFAVHASVEGERFFHGYVKSFSAGDVDERGYRHYRARIVPDLWKLTKRFNCRTFAGVAVENIISNLLGEHSISDHSIAATGSGYPECCVQYQETDFDFISRLLEDLGLYYYFKHDKNAHKLVVAKDVGAYDYCGSVGHGVEIASWEHSWTTISGVHLGRDYDYLTPTDNAVQSEQTTLASPLALMLDVYEYPVRVDLETGSKSSNSDRQNKVRARIEAQEAGHETATGTGSSVRFAAGHKFQLSRHDASSETSKNWVLVEVKHDATEAAHGSGHQQSSYANSFECIPAEVPYRPPLSTARPRIFGLQTATVVDEAATDPAKFGRVRVRFPWQRDDYGANLGWVRVAQTMAGKGYGSQFMPRLGHEVVVSFIDGDPDRPLIVGSVYNADNREPYELATNKSQSGIKTRSYPDGATDAFNEILLEDKKDAEIFHIQAQKDMTRLVKNDDSTEVGHDQSITVKHDCSEDITNDRTLHVGNDQSDTVDKNRTVSIGENLDETVGKSMTLTISENRTMTISKDLSEDVSGGMSVSVAKDSSTTIKGAMTLSVTKDATITVEGAQTETITKELSISAKKITLTGSDEVALVAGSAKIVLKKNGDIAIEGKAITIKGSGDVVIKGSKVAVN
jgi:type VI secretion system secreted protein VgrG